MIFTVVNLKFAVINLKTSVCCEIIYNQSNFSEWCSDRTKNGQDGQDFRTVKPRLSKLGLVRWAEILILILYYVRWSPRLSMAPATLYSAYRNKVSRFRAFCFLYLLHWVVAVTPADVASLGCFCLQFLLLLMAYRPSSLWFLLSSVVGHQLLRKLVGFSLGLILWVKITG